MRSVEWPNFPFGILRAEIERVDGTWDRDALVVDLLDGAEGAPGGRDIGAVGAGKRDLVLRGSHHRVELLARVVCEPDSDGGRADREHDQRQHQYLLTPLPTKQPPRPAEDRPPRGATAGARRLLHARSLLERKAHDLAFGASSDSGPGGGIV